MSELKDNIEKAPIEVLVKDLETANDQERQINSEECALANRKNELIKLKTAIKEELKKRMERLLRY